MGQLSWMLCGIMGFVLGAIPFAVVVPKIMGLPDPRSYGSGNPGATNVMRSGSRLAANSVFFLDFAKGAVAVGLSWLIASEAAASVAAACAVAGHCWSPFLGFKGGKGVATGLGCLLVLDWILFVIAGGIIAAAFAAFRVVSLASVIGIVAAAATAVLLETDAPGGYTGAAAATIAFIVVMRHRDNFRRLNTGSEFSFARDRKDKAEDPQADDSADEQEADEPKK